MPEKESNRSKSLEKRTWGLFRGEWFLLLAVFLLTGIAAFFYTRAQLSAPESVEKAVTVDVQEPERMN